jgi:hypothetical protein
MKPKRGAFLAKRTSEGMYVYETESGWRPSTIAKGLLPV